MSATVQHMSADHYLATGDTRPRRTELVSGEVCVNSPRALHQLIISYLVVEITLWIRGGPGRGKVPLTMDSRLSDSDVFAPDVLWLREGRLTSDIPFLTGPPDLVAEVRSPSTWKRDTGVKKDRYEASGLPELWLVDTSQNRVLVYRRSVETVAHFDIELVLDSADILTSPMLPGFELVVAKIFDQFPTT
jgi:Uma2 family endonuclease